MDFPRDGGRLTARRVGCLFAVLLVLMLVPSLAEATKYRKISVPVVLGGKPRFVWAENGSINGLPCWMYEYATSVGLDECEHPGVDIDADFEPLYSATQGRVLFAGPSDAYGPMYVAIRVTNGRYKHDTIYYGHMSDIDVDVGQVVAIGTRLGVSGTAGTGPHLHFEVRTPPNTACPLGCSIDPIPLLKREK